MVVKFIRLVFGDDNLYIGANLMYVGGSLVDHETTENKRNMRLLGATKRIKRTNGNT